MTLRRALHADPELGLELPRTQQKVLAALEGLPLEITTRTRTTSVVAVLRGAHPGPVVLLRGDMDALPIGEATGLEYASANGNMHACGHDLHTAGLIGAARMLCEHREELHGDVTFMFQPGEERPGGEPGASDGTDYGPDLGAGREDLDASGRPFASYFSGNIIQICPVGALTSAKYRFRARPMDLVSTDSVTEHDASGSAIRVDMRRGVVLRHLAGNDPEVNEEWITDKDRFAFTWSSQPDRLTVPLVRDEETGELVPTSWSEAIALASAGLAEVPNPSALFLAGRDHAAPGTAVFAGMEGTRPLLVEEEAGKLVEKLTKPNGCSNRLTPPASATSASPDCSALTA